MPFCAPQIVYQNSWLSQTADITGVIVFTPTVAGLYRLSSGAYVDCTAGSGSLTVNTLTSLVVSYSGSPNWNVLEQFVYLSAGESVAFGTTLSGGATVDHYDAYFTIEQVG